MPPPLHSRLGAQLKLPAAVGQRPFRAKVYSYLCLLGGFKQTNRKRDVKISLWCGCSVPESISTFGNQYKGVSQPNFINICFTSSRGTRFTRLVGVTIDFTSIYTGIAASVGLFKSLVPSQPTCPPVNSSPTVNSTPPQSTGPLPFYQIFSTNKFPPNIFHQIFFTNNFPTNIFHPFSTKMFLSETVHQKIF